MPSSDEANAMQPAETPKKSSRAALILATIVAAALVYALLAWISQRVVPNPELHAGVGQPLQLCNLRAMNNDSPPIFVADLKGHVTLLHFWGTWCRPCRDELPHIAQLRKRFAGQETFRLLAVSCPAGDQADDLQSLQEETAALLKRLKIELPTYYDPDGATDSAARTLVDSQAFPLTILLDRKATVRAVWVGYRPGVETEMERYIEIVLEEKGKK